MFTLTVEKNMKLILLIAIVLIFPLYSSAHKFEAKYAIIDHPWMKIFDTNGAGYFKIKNISSYDLYLMGAVSKDVKKIELHKVTMEDDIAKMRPLEGGLEIKVGETIELKPMSFHLMFFGINKDYEEGQMMGVELIFKSMENHFLENLENLNVKFKVDMSKSTHQHDH